MRLGGAWCYLFIPLGMGGVEGFLGWLRVGWIGAGIGEFYLVQLGVSIGGTLAAFGPTRLLGFGCISVSAGVADCGSALTAGHLFQTPKR